MAKIYYSTEEDEKKKYYEAQEGYVEKAYQRDLYRKEQEKTASQKAAEELKIKQQQDYENRPLLQKVGEGVSNFFKNAFKNKQEEATKQDLQYEEEAQSKKEWQIDKQPKEAHIKAAQIEIANLDKKSDDLDLFKSEADRYIAWGFEKQSELIRGGMSASDAMKAIKDHNEYIRSLDLDNPDSPERKQIEERMNQLGLNNKNIDPRKQSFADRIADAKEGVDTLQGSIKRTKATWQDVISAYQGETDQGGVAGGLAGLKEYVTNIENAPIVKGAASTLYNMEEKKIQEKIAKEGEGSLTPKERATLEQIKARQAYSERPSSYAYKLGEGLGATGFMAVEWALTGALFGGAGAVGKGASFGQKLKAGIKQATQVSTTFGLPEITADITERAKGTQLIEPTENGYKIRFANNGQDFPTSVVMGASLGYVNNVIESIGGELLGQIVGGTTKVINKGLLKAGMDVPKALAPVLQSKTWNVLSKVIGGKGKLNQLIARSDFAGELFEEYLQTYTEKAFNGEDLTITPEEHKQIIGGTALATIVLGAVNVVTDPTEEQNLQEGETIIKSDNIATEDSINNLPPKVRDVVADVVNQDGKEDITKADLVEASNRIMTAIEEGKITAEDLNAEPEAVDLGSIVRSEVGRIREEEGIVTTEDLGVTKLPSGEEVGDVKKIAKYLSDYGVTTTDTQIKVAKQLAEKIGVEQTQKIDENPLSARVSETKIAQAIQTQERYAEKVGSLSYDNFVKKLDNVEQAIEEIKRIPKYQNIDNKEVLKSFYSDVSEDQKTLVDPATFSIEAQGQLANIITAIQEAMTNPPKRGSSVDEVTGERTFFKEGVNYPDVVSEPFRKKAIMEKVVNAFLDNEVPPINTNAYFAYQEILNSVRDDQDVVFDEEVETPKEEKGLTKELTSNNEEVDKKKEKVSKQEVKQEEAQVEPEPEEVEDLVDTSKPIEEYIREVESLRGEKLPRHIKNGMRFASEMTEQQARDMAIDIIRPYAQRGDDIKDFKGSGYGQTLKYFAGDFSIGGYVDSKRVSNNTVLMQLGDGRVFRFDLQELWNEAKSDNGLDDLPFRVDRNGELVENRPLAEKEKEDILALNEKYFGDKYVNFVQRLLTPNGQDALGKYGYSWIDLVEGQADITMTFNHEAGHKAFSLLSPEQKKSLIEEVKKLRGEKYLLNKWGNYKEDTINKYLYAGMRAMDFEKKRAKYKTFSFLHDAKERFEISDRDARLYSKVKGRVFEDNKMVESGTYVGKLSDFFRHPDFYAQYPDAKKIQLNLTIMNNPKVEIKGQINDEEWDVVTKSYIPAEIELVAPDRAEARNGILHELQHWIQVREKFARGGNMNRYKNERISRMADIQTLLGIIDFKKTEIEKEPEYINWRAIRNATLNTDAKLKAMVVNSQEDYNAKQIRIASILERVDKDPRFADVRKRWEALQTREQKLKDEMKNYDGSRFLTPEGNKNSDWNKYLRTAGEVEARDVEFRSKLSMAQRAKVQPLVGQGIAVQDMIVRYRGVDVNNVDMAAEEELVEIFAQYMKNPTVENLNTLLSNNSVEPVQETFVQKIMRVFNDLIKAIKGAINGSYDIRTFYQDLSGGRFRNWESEYATDYDYRFNSKKIPDEELAKYRLEGAVEGEVVSDERLLEKRILNLVDSTPVIRLPELLNIAEDLTGRSVETRIPRMRKFGRPNGYFKPSFTDPLIVLNRELFTPKKNEEGEVIETTEERIERLNGIEKTLAHEIGHAIDFIGDPRTVSRGNLLGRVATLHKYMYREYDGILNKDIKKELKALTQIWKPFDPKADTDFTKYRYSAPELYADALSVMFNDYELLRSVAPNFHDSFFRYLARKPEVEKTLLEAWDQIKLGRNIGARVDKMKEGYAKANLKRREIDLKREVKRLDLLTALKTAVVTEFAPVYKQIKDQYKDKAIRLSKEEEVRTAFEKMQTTDNRMRQYVKDVEDNFLTPLIDVGIDENTVGAIMQLERQIGDRKDFANPQGLVYEYAKETLDEIKSKLTADQKSMLDDRLAWFRDTNFKIIEQAYKSGVFSQQFFEEIATVNKNSYTPFAVVDYISKNKVYAGLIKMKGTVKQVENPIITQVLKSAAIIQKTEENSAKKKYIEVVFGEFNNELIQAKAVRDSKGRFIKWKETTDGMKVLELLEDGKKVGYEVDPYIYKVFNNVVEKGSFQDLTRLVLTPFRFINKNFKLLVTTLRPSFWYSNIIRDVKRSDRMIYAMLSEKNSGYKKVDPIGFEFMFEWIKSIPKSVRFAKGVVDEDPELRKMIDLGILSTKEVWATEDYSPEVSVESVLAPAKRMTGLLYNEKVEGGMWAKFTNAVKKSIFGKTIGFFYDKMEAINRVIEANTKIAGYQILTKKGMSEERAGMKVRNYVGTPNFRERGTATFLTNEVFVFSNVAVQAWRTEAEIATNPKTRSGYLLKMSLSLAPKLLLIAAELGLIDHLFGEDDKGRKLSDMFKRMTEYDKTNYFAIPISWVGNKVLYWRIPSDESERGLHALMRKTLTTIVGKGQNWSQIADLFAGQVPFSGTNPTVEIARIFTSYMRDNNPYDSFRGRLAIPDKIWNQGGVTRMMAVGKLMLNETGLTTFSFYDSPAQTTSEMILKLPVLERALRLTDYGLKELETNAEKEKEMLKARDSAKVEDKADEIKLKLRDNPNYNFDNDVLELQKKYGNPENTVTYTNIRKKVKEIILRDRGLGEYDRMIDAPNSDSKVAIARSVKSGMGGKEFEDYLKTLAQYEIMTDAMNNSLEETGVIDSYLSRELTYILKEARSVKPEGE